MSFITTDYSKLEERNFDALPTGEYEMVIRQVMEKVTKNGAESMQVTLVVRNDLAQVPALAKTNGKHSNRYVFMDNWKRKATGEYDTEGFMYILQAAGVPEGTPINSVDDFIDLLQGKPVKVYVKKEVDDYNTQDPESPVYKNTVAPWNFSETNYKAMNHQFDNKANMNNQQQQAPQVVDTDEEDYPF